MRIKNPCFAFKIQKKMKESGIYICICHFFFVTLQRV